MALRTLSSIPSTDYLNEAFKSVKSVLQSSASPRLKKTAIHAITKLDQSDHNRIWPLLNILRRLVDEIKEDSSVQAHALYVMYRIHEANEDMKMMTLERDTCFRMLEMLPALNEWDHSLVLESMITSYAPQTHSEAHHLIEIVLPQLQHVNTSVILNALKFIMYLINYVDYLQEGLIKRLSNSIVTLLNKPPELQFLVLRNVILLLLSREEPLLKVDVSYFFVEFNDPIYIKDTKLEILYLLAKHANLSQILQELKEYATDIDIQMSRKAIRAIGNLAVKLEHSASECVAVLLELLDFGVEYIVQEIVSVFKNILRKYPGQFESCVDKLVQFTDSVQEPESRSSMIWIITQHSSYLPNYLELFQIFSSNFQDETLEVQFSILNSSVKFFVRSPTEATEKLCVDILRYSTEKIDNPDLRDRAFMYWRLLSAAQQNNGLPLSIETVKDIVDGDLPLITLNTRLDPQVLEELELNIGSIASIYLKPVSQVFRLNKTKVLPKSPALNLDRDNIDIIADSSSTRSSSVVDLRFSAPSRTSSSPIKKMDDYDKPAEKVNSLKTKKRSSSSAVKLTRKPSVLARKLSMRRPFA